VDLGAPVSYLVLEPGVPVYDPDGTQVGTVEHVLAAAEEDIFDGLVVDARAGPGGWRFADATQVAELGERGVALNVGIAALHEPRANPAALSAGPEETEDSLSEELERKLKRAWDYISGNY
jgi:hypothetical protein